MVSKTLSDAFREKVRNCLINHLPAEGVTNICREDGGQSLRIFCDAVQLRYENGGYTLTAAINETPVAEIIEAVRLSPGDCLTLSNYPPTVTWDV